MPTEDEIEAEILDLIEKGNVTLGLTDDGEVGVWLMRQELGRDMPYFASDSATEALYGAAVKLRKERPEGVRR